jgi:hypothetical protein
MPLSVIFTHRFASRSHPPLLASEALHFDCLLCERITTAPSRRPWRTLCFTEVLNCGAQGAWECCKHSDKMSPNLLLQYFSSSKILEGNGGPGTLRVLHFRSHILSQSRFVLKQQLSHTFPHSPTLISKRLWQPSHAFHTEALPHRRANGCGNPRASACFPHQSSPTPNGKWLRQPSRFSSSSPTPICKRSQHPSRPETALQHRLANGRDVQSSYTSSGQVQQVKCKVAEK